MIISSGLSRGDAYGRFHPPRQYPEQHPGFPQLWKNLWKFRPFDVPPSMPALIYRDPRGAKVREGLYFLGFFAARPVVRTSHRRYCGRKCQFS
jgi:hypothetical protein